MIKMLNKIILVFFIFIFFISCKTQKNIINKEYKEIDSTTIKSKDSIVIISEQYEKSILIYKDSLVKVKSLLEKSTNVSEDSSYLETSYSVSIAKILSNGKLYHSLYNKDSIPSRVIIRESNNLKNILEESKENNRTDIDKNKKNQSNNKEKIYIEKVNYKYCIICFIVGFSIGIVLILLWKKKIYKN